MGKLLYWQGNDPSKVTPLSIREAAQQVLTDGIERRIGMWTVSRKIKLTQELNHAYHHT